MDFQRIAEIGIRQQQKAVYKNWADNQFAKTCAKCCMNNVQQNCCGENCPVAIAHKEALERIASHKDEKIKTIFYVAATEEENKNPTVGDIRDLAIAYNVINRLENAGITSISELDAMSDEEIEKIPRIGKTTILAIRNAINNRKNPSPEKIITERNRKITVSFEKNKFSKEEWKILQILIKKGGITVAKR